MQGRIVICIAATDLAESMARVLDATGCQVISTTNPDQGMALLFINRRADLVILDYRLYERHKHLASSLKALRPDVRILVVAVEPLDSIPELTDSCVSLAAGSDSLISALGRLSSAPAAA